MYNWPQKWDENQSQNNMGGGGGGGCFEENMSKTKYKEDNKNGG